MTNMRTLRHYTCDILTVQCTVGNRDSKIDAFKQITMPFNELIGIKQLTHLI